MAKVDDTEKAKEKQGHISPNCPTKKGGKGNKGQKGQRPYNGQWYDGEGYGRPQSFAYQQNGYSGYRGHMPSTICAQPD
eukprot:5043117-Amphidinium_carterae.1